ncbi:MAG: hypothetical protein H6718_18415 [Polyangiaceae bacterium]|nr:hypothetical protein [Polyangiaceae bacterium]
MAHLGRLGRVGLFASLLGVAACNDKPSGDSAASAEPVSASAAAAPSAPTAPSAAAVASAAAPSAAPLPVASEAPSAAPSASPAAAAIDPELLARMKKVASACSWNGKVLNENCKALAGWHEYLFEPINDHQHDLMRLLEDKDPKIVFLAAVGLSSDGITGTSDPALAKVLFDAFEREKEPAMCAGIAMQAASVKTADFGLEERAKALLKEHPTSECRGEFAAAVLGRNPQLYDLIVELAKTDKVPDVRHEAASGLRRIRHDKEREKNNCKVWAELIDDTGEVYEATAGWLIGTSGSRTLSVPCSEQWPLLLSRAQGLASTGKVQEVSWESGICGLLEEDSADGDTKTKAKAVLRKLVEVTGNLEHARVAALHCLRRFDSDAKTFAKTFENDSSEKVQAAAKRILETKP